MTCLSRRGRSQSVLPGLPDTIWTFVGWMTKARECNESFHYFRNCDGDDISWLYFSIGPWEVFSGPRTTVQAISGIAVHRNDERDLVRNHFCSSRQRRGLQGFVGACFEDGTRQE